MYILLTVCIYLYIQDGKTSVFRAIEKNSQAMAQWLVTLGANIHREDNVSIAYVAML